MAFVVQRIEAGDGTCNRCGERGAKLYDEEQIEDLFGIPLKRKYLWCSWCKTCGVTRYAKSEPQAIARLGKTPGVRARIGVTIALVALLVPMAIGNAIWRHHCERAYLADPMVGDKWTVDATEWPDLRTSDTAAKYGRVIVRSVDADVVGLSGCGITHSKESEAKERCESYPIALSATNRSDLADLYADDVIDSVDSKRKSETAEDSVLVIYGLLLVGWAVLGLRHRKKVALAPLPDPRGLR